METPGVCVLPFDSILSMAGPHPSLLNTSLVPRWSMGRGPSHPKYLFQFLPLPTLSISKEEPAALETLLGSQPAAVRQ